jgi:hypothetical protein
MFLHLLIFLSSSVRYLNTPGIRDLALAFRRQTEKEWSLSKIQVNDTIISHPHFSI